MAEQKRQHLPLRALTAAFRYHFEGVHPELSLSEVETSIGEIKDFYTYVSADSREDEFEKVLEIVRGWRSSEIAAESIAVVVPFTDGVDDVVNALTEKLKDVSGLTIATSADVKEKSFDALVVVGVDRFDEKLMEEVGALVALPERYIAVTHSSFVNDLILFFAAPSPLLELEKAVSANVPLAPLPKPDQSKRPRRTDPGMLDNPFASDAVFEDEHGLAEISDSHFIDELNGLSQQIESPEMDSVGGTVVGLAVGLGSSSDEAEKNSQEREKESAGESSEDEGEKSDVSEKVANSGDDGDSEVSDGVVEEKPSVTDDKKVEETSTSEVDEESASEEKPVEEESPKESKKVTSDTESIDQDRIAALRLTAPRDPQQFEEQLAIRMALQKEAAAKGQVSKPTGNFQVVHAENDEADTSSFIKFAILSIVLVLAIVGLTAWLLVSLAS